MANPGDTVYEISVIVLQPRTQTIRAIVRVGVVQANGSIAEQPAKTINLPWASQTASEDALASGVAADPSLAGMTAQVF